MPVDLSKIGLEGLESFSQRQMMDAQANHMNELAANSQYEREETQRLNDLAQQALSDAASGKRGGGAEFSADGYAEQMDSIAEPLEVIGDAFVRGGAVKQGMDALSKASEIRKRESDMRNDVSLDRQRQLENIQKGAKIVANTLGIAQNESEWRQGLKELDGTGLIEPDMMEQLKQMPFDPNVAAYFRQRAIDAEAQARLDMQQETLDNTERYRQGVAADRDRRFQLAEIQADDLRKYRARLLKQGGKNGASSNIPTGEQVNQVKAILKEGVFANVDLDDDLTKTELDAAAVEITTNAKALIRDNKALDWNTAIQRSIMQAQAEGKFKITPATKEFFGYRNDRIGKKVPASVDYNPPGTGNNPDSAMNIPTANGKPDKSKMKKGKYYITSQGRALWNGSAFEMDES